ncbi:MAG: hypothetical protein ABSG75_07315 [Syntrophales bacterium]|jgi:hypothetical protein
MNASKELLYDRLIRISSIVISGIALIVAIKSCQVSNNNHLDINRPYLTLQPIKNPKTDSFIDFSWGDKALMHLTGYFKISNVGRTPALNIHTKGYVLESKDIALGGDDQKPIIKPLPEISLQPGEEKIITFLLRVGMKRGEEDTITPEKREVAIVTPILFSLKMPFFYSSKIDEKKRFKTSVTYEYPNYKDAPILIESIVDKE